MNTAYANIKWSRVNSSPILAAAITGVYVSAFYILGNTTMLPVTSMLVVFLVLVLPITIVVTVSTYLLRRIHREPYVEIVSVFTCAVYLLVILRKPIFGIQFVSAVRDQFEGVSWILVHLAIFLIPAVAITYVFRRNIGKYMLILVAMSLAAMALSISTPASTDTSSHAGHISQTGKVPPSITFGQKPNIYLVLADAYGSFAYMRENNIDVSTFRNTLQEMNFRLYDETFSNYHPTTSSMLAMLNMEHHYYLSTIKSSEVNKSARAVIGGANNLMRLLKSNGYQTEYIHQGTYLMLHGCTADYCSPTSTSTSGAQFVLSEILPSWVMSKFQTRESKWNQQSREEIYAMTVDRLESGSKTQDPQFQYIHIYEPGHSPNTQDGTCDSNKQLEAYSRRVKRTSAYLAELVQSITMHDRSAVIVLAGDHGPYITQQCQRKVDLDTLAGYRDRVGSLLAVRWPSDYQGQYDSRLKTTVNLFRYVLASLAVTDTEILNSVVPDDVYIQGTNDILQIITDGDITIPPKVLNRTEAPGEKGAN